MKKKTLYGLRLRNSDTDNWSDTIWYKTKRERDNDAAENRILLGLRTYSFEEKKTEEEISQIEFNPTI